MQFLKNSNLPKKPVKVCLLGERYYSIHAALQKIGIDTIPVPEHPYLPYPISCHADLQFCYIGNGKAYAAFENTCFIQHLQSLFLDIKPCHPLGIQYPDDVRLNCAIQDNYVWINRKTIDKNLMTELMQNGLMPIDTPQGYTKCSIAIVSPNAIMSSDDTIARAAEIHQIDVLHLPAGGIILEGYPTGFIGGCCGLIDENLLAFTGKISSFPEHQQIFAFLKKHHIDYIELTDEALFDIGSIFPLIEK